MVTAIIILLSLCSGTCVIRYAKGIGIFFGLYRMLEYSGVGLHKFHCIYNDQLDQYAIKIWNYVNYPAPKG